MPDPLAPSLGAYLRARRTRLDPATLGLPAGRRRTPGLRREEVAQRANISPTWYTWLEQGRGGAPSADVLDRLARGLLLTEPEREHLFLLAHNRPPAVRDHQADDVTPRLQRVLDAFGDNPAMIKTPTWDVVAWNRAAAALFVDYATLPPAERNVMRMMFGRRDVRAFQEDWWRVARFVVATFRASATRAGPGAAPAVRRLVDELSATSPEFATLWHEHEIAAPGGGLKRINHPVAGPLALEFSAFAVEGSPELGLILYTPATPTDAGRLRGLLADADGCRLIDVDC